MNDADAELKGLGLQVTIEQKTDANVPEGQVISQSIAEGDSAKKGDTVTIIVSSGKPTATVPNVIGNSSSTAKSTLENAGFKVAINEQFSSSVSKDIVISQSPQANTMQSQGTQITLIVSKGSEAATTPVQSNWSDWTDSLPSYVSNSSYSIELRTLYRSRDIETTSSTKSSMDGWELYNTASGKGDYGSWSDWSQNAVTKSDMRDVETQTRYRYSNKETITSSSSTMSGWTLENTTSEWGSYGSWSDWSTGAVSNSNSREVESKNQYRYRDISYTTAYSAWGGWSDWSPDYVASNDTTDVQTATIYGYYYFNCPNCGKRWHGWNFNCFAWDGGCGTYVPEYNWHQMWSDVSWSQAGFQEFHGTGKYVTYYFGDRWFKWNDNGQPRTGYRYRTRASYQEKSYGAWSSWSDSSYSNSSSREVETRTVYRFRDRQQITTYHFYRWGSWSAWSATEVTGNSNRQVETSTFYRYRDKVDKTTYYYRRWSAWSNYSTTPITMTDTRQVQTKTQYRYKSK